MRSLRPFIKQLDLCELEARQNYTGSSCLARATQEDPISKQNQKIEKAIHETHRSRIVQCGIQDLREQSGKNLQPSLPRMLEPEPHRAAETSGSLSTHSSKGARVGRTLDHRL